MVTFHDKPALFYLASQSPRRLSLLHQMGLQPQLLLPSKDEDPEELETVLPFENAQSYVARVAMLKWQVAQQRLRDQKLPLAPILSADTTVVLGQRIFGKPTNNEDAREILQTLAGKTHQVMTAVVCGYGDQVASAMNISQVSFGEMVPEDLDKYVLSGEPMGKAGAYGIQGLAAQWVKKIDGSYTGIMGLPLHETLQLLRSFGVY